MFILWGHNTLTKSAVRPLNTEAKIITMYAGVINLKELYPVLHKKINLNTMVSIYLYPTKALHYIISVFSPNPNQQYHTKRSNIRQCFIHFCMTTVKNMLQLLLHTVNICCNCYNSKISYTKPAVLYGKIQMDVQGTTGVLQNSTHFQCFCKTLI